MLNPEPDITINVLLLHSSVKNISIAIEPAQTETKHIFSIIIECFNFFKDFIYLFLERGEGKERARETSVCGCLLHAPYWGPGRQPRHVP